MDCKKNYSLYNDIKKDCCVKVLKRRKINFILKLRVVS